VRKLSLLFALASPALFAAEEEVALKDGAGKNLVTASCASCHSLDYIEMNGGVLDRAGWEKSVAKMIDIMGAPVPREHVPQIVDYLATRYGR
jgi:cytochrome c5